MTFLKLSLIGVYNKCTIMVQRKYEDYTKIVQKSKTDDQAHCYYSSSSWRNGLAY